MSITVRYFASLREALGVEVEQLELATGVDTVAALRAQLVARGEEWTRLAGPRIRAAVNQRLANESAPIADGDELAFFPPVTGG